MARILRTAAVAFAALALSIFFAAPAGASSSTSFSSGGVTRSTASWTTSSQLLKVTDNYEDGWGAFSDWNVGQIQSRCVNEGGVLSTTTCPIRTSAGRSIVYGICSKDGSVLKGCGVYRSDVTWS